MKGDTESNGLSEKAVMLLRGIIRTTKCHIENSTGCILSRCQKGRDGNTPFERVHGKKPTQEFVPFGAKVLAKQITADPMNRMNPRYKYGIWRGINARTFTPACWS